MNKDNGLKYYSELSLMERALYQQRCYSFLRDLNRQYPHFHEWYAGLFKESGELKAGRQIIFCEKLNQIAGIIILKKDGIEKKICTLRVSSPFQGMGIATDLVKAGNEWLECDKPLITVSRQLKPQYDQLFRYFGFSEEEKKWGYYSVFSSEYAFNGSLAPKPVIVDTVEFDYLGSIIRKIVGNGGHATREEVRWAVNFVDYIVPQMARLNMESYNERYRFAN